MFTGHVGAFTGAETEFSAPVLLEVDQVWLWLMWHGRSAETRALLITHENTVVLAVERIRGRMHIVRDQQTTPLGRPLVTAIEARMNHDDESGLDPLVARRLDVLCGPSLSHG